MRINHNISALNAWRNINQTQYSMSKTLERLSSGLRINRAGDDAAGLAISEKMRGQIKGLNMAIKNAQDAISLIQTAEGALTEVHSILQRMRELAVQAASDTNTDVDRYQIQAELDQLREEIDRIARTTEFNTMKLLDGKIESFRPQADVKVVTGGNFNLQASQSTDLNGLSIGNAQGISGAKAVNLVINGVTLGDITISASGSTVKIIDGGATITSFQVTNEAIGSTRVITAGGLKFEFVVSDASLGVVDSVKISIATSVSVTFDDVHEGSYVVEVGQFVGAGTSSLDVRVNYFNETGLASALVVDFSQGNAFYGTVSGSISYDGSKFAFDLTGLKGIVFTWTTGVYDINSFGGALPMEEVIDSGVVRAEERWYQDTSLIFQIGANEGHNMIAGLDDMRSSALGLTPDSLKVTDQNSAERAIMVIDAAIHKVSSARAQLGAVQNRLEHTISNLGVAAENLTAAESRIRDADMAKEMMEFTKQQILLQSSMAMLAQSNTLPQNVLQLMR
ncbi:MULTISPECIES: flagellin N-terminal helical domain-containing protein [unclassified Thermotoga]|uniref:flagellin N-terminal helical domain-containing protein n=1 Tax=unclassified Thermotoga TaxID=2631113 RepID=UPI000540C066|nr:MULTISPECIES: flagellin [unclassified Thermotoga]AIY87538.1 flagellin domain-containing protein [Thermotoga sp. Cell2]KHC92466.1 flagellin domain-containing protein [Thermotoga sp. TBGT1765]KHC93858.1 flagellin domain-containing protein [Thermotoga sp. TBGT1766]KHC96520.1 flagellin domain-containing protein [Thermotoga sp. Xyl54]